MPKRGRMIRILPSLLIPLGYLVTNVDHLVVLLFRLESELASVTTAVSVRVVPAARVAFTCTVIATKAPIGFFDVQGPRVPMLHEAAALPQEFFGAVMEQEGVLPLRLQDSIAYPELTKVVPGGKVSLSVTALAVLGPLFTTEM